MRLYLYGNWHTAVPLRAFRQQYGLGEDFAMAHFAPKDFAGLAKLDHASELLDLLANQLVEYAQTLNLAVLEACTAVQEHFDHLLCAQNAQVGLREVEIDYAVAGLGDALRHYAYVLLQARALKLSTPDFVQVYQRWVGESARVASQFQDYSQQGRMWQVQVVTTVYGRAGLWVHGDALPAPVLVADERYACPAEGFMGRLLSKLIPIICPVTD